LDAVNATIPQEDKKFVRGGRPMVGSLAWSARERLQTRTLVLGTTSQDQPLAVRIRQHRLMVHALLTHLGLLDDRFSVDSITEGQAAGGAICLAVYAGPGTRRGMHHLLKELEGSPHVTVLPIGPEEIAAGALEHCHAVLFPGGSSTRQGESLGAANRQRVRAFVESGGGYVGICAGAYLATVEFPWALKILDAKTYSAEWKRGRGVVQLELTTTGRKILGSGQVWCDVRYHNGPILVRARRDDLPDYQSLAVFRSEVADYGAPAGVMVGSPAIVSGRFGKGRVLCYSPHPDQTKGLEELVRRGVRWVASGAYSERLTGRESAAAENASASS
jgi:putative intracellular protease/amidase